MTLRDDAERLLRELTDQRRSRWWLALAGVFTAHVALAVGLAYQGQQQPKMAAGAPMVVQIANFAAAPAAVASSAAPSPEEPPEEPTELAEVEPKPDPKPEQKPEPKPEPVPEPETALPEPEQAKSNPEPTQQVEQQVASRASHAAQETASEASAPVASAHDAQQISQQRATWEGRLLNHLERHKRYPYMARSRREEGIATIRFTLDRDGRVLDVHLDESSGSFLLDKEVKAMLKRAQPLSQPPAELAGDTLELVLPIEFALR